MSESFITSGVEGSPVSAPEIIIRNKGIEAIFEEAIKLWYDKFPQEVLDFKEDMRWHKDMKAKENAMTAEGHFMCKGLVPPTLKNAITEVLISQDVLDAEIAPHWLKHPDLVNVFFKIFKEGCVNETSDLR